MNSNNRHFLSNAVDVKSRAFIQAFNQFIETGDFIALTRQFEQGFVQTGSNNHLSFAVKKATAFLLDSGILLIEPVEPELASSKKESTKVDYAKKSYKNIIISSGIHGNETAPIEIVQQLISDIIAHKTQVKHRTLFIIGNPVAMNRAKRFQTENLNRLFSGKYQEVSPCFEKFRAEKLEAYVGKFFNADTANDASLAAFPATPPTSSAKKVTNYHYDLHTAIRHSKYEKFAIYPYQADKQWNKEQLSFMAICGVNTVLFGHGPSGTFSYFSSSHFSAHSFTIELGKTRPFGENNIADFTAIINNLCKLISDKKIALKPFNNNHFNLFKALGDITKVSENFRLFIDDDVSNFTDFPIDSLLSTDRGQEYRTTQRGESIIFPNADVGNGQRAALMVVPTILS
ncbi:MAG: succinylglutamate desuccinylase [Colwellia sp.]